jgi:hypothetical protein
MQIVTRDVSEVLANPGLLRQPGTATILAGTADVVVPIAAIQELAKQPGAPEKLKEFAQALVREQLLEEEYTAGMSSYRKKTTGVDNTVFVCGKFSRHVPRIKVAVDPPTHIDPFGDNAVVAISDGRVLEGELPSKIRKQVEWFCEVNRATLIDYWEKRIDDDELRERLLASKSRVEAGRPRSP